MITKFPPKVVLQTDEKTVTIMHAGAPPDIKEKLLLIIKWPLCNRMAFTAITV